MGGASKMAVTAKPRPDLPARLNLGCGDDTRDGWWNVDALDAPGVDEIHNLEETPWPWPDEHFETILASHVFEHLTDVKVALRECERLLVPGGQLMVIWPVGLNELADPDHKHRWVWDTPLYYCGERPWDPDVGLEVVDRSVTIHNHLQGGWKWVLDRLIALYTRQYGSGRWQFDLPATSGEFTVIFEKP